MLELGYASFPMRANTIQCVALAYAPPTFSILLAIAYPHPTKIIWYFTKKNKNLLESIIPDSQAPFFSQYKIKLTQTCSAEALKMIKEILNIQFNKHIHGREKLVW